MELISMTDFVLKQESECIPVKLAETINPIFHYAHFLKQPLRLSMFVPCDDEGNILIEPAKDNFSFYTHKNLSVQEEFKEAKEKVLFNVSKEYVESNIYDDNSFFYGLETIEDLITGNYLTLTESAIKLIGL